MKKRLWSLLSIILFVAIACSASAGTSISGSKATKTDIPTFLFYKMEDGIGCGDCPVYTAPTIKAYRCNDGDATCSTDKSLYIVGLNAEGWLMGRYSTNDGSTRVGYIPPSYIENFSTWRKLDFSYVKSTANTTLYVTDNPLNNYSAYAALDTGETYYILGDYDYHGDWWYIECTVDGMVARGFIKK